MSDNYQDLVLQHLKAQTGLLIKAVETLSRIEAAQGASAAYEWTPEGLPVCPKHGEVMSRREKQGDLWYSHRVTDPDTGEVHYCKGYKSKSSPGWDIDDPTDSPPPPAPPAPTAPPRPGPSQIRPLDIQQTAPASEPAASHHPPDWWDEIPNEPAAKQPAQASPHIAQPIEGDSRTVFYALGSKAVQDGKIEWQKFNGLVDIASRQGFKRAIQELEAIAA